MTPLVAVNYGVGSASPSVIAAAARGCCDLLWHCDAADEHCTQMLPVLRRLGTVVTSAGDASADQRASAIAAFRPDGITTFCDHRLVETAECARRLELRYQSPSAALPLTDKYAQRHAFRSANLQVIRFSHASSPSTLACAVGEVGAPVVVKPVHGYGSSRTFRVAGTADLEVTLASLSAAELADGFIVEEELAGQPGAGGQGIGDYVSVETVTVSGEHHVIGIVGRLSLAAPYRERGGFYPSTLEPGTGEAVTQLAVRALSALGVSFGACHTEIKLTPRGPEILEVNGRLGGHVAWLIGRHGGPDLIRAALLAALGRWDPPAPYELTGVAFRHVPPAPMRVGTVTSVDGVREVRAMECVEDLAIRVRRGMTLDWRQGTGSCIAEISGWADTHARMVCCTSQIEDKLHVSLAAQ
jgi:biotin carboxylase